MKKEEIFLSIGGAIAAIGVSYLIYREQTQQAAVAAANAENNSEEIESQLANQQAAVAALPQISVPAISSSVSPTDTSQQSQAPAPDSDLESIISAFMSSDSSPVTNTITPIASIGIDSLLNTTPNNPSTVEAPLTFTNQYTPPPTPSEYGSSASNIYSSHPIQNTNTSENS